MPKKADKDAKQPENPFQPAPKVGETLETVSEVVETPPVTKEKTLETPPKEQETPALEVVKAPETPENVVVDMPVSQPGQAPQSTVATELVLDSVLDPAPVSPTPETPAPGADINAPKKIGRPPGSKTKPKSPSTIADVEAVKPVDFRAMGNLVFDLSTNALAMGLGPEWKPQSPEERELVADSLAKYFESQQLKDIPPGMMLLLVCGVYALPRVNQPKTKEKIAAGWTWLKMKIAGKNPFKKNP